MMFFDRPPSCHATSTSTVSCSTSMPLQLLVYINTTPCQILHILRQDIALSITLALILLVRRYHHDTTGGGSGAETVDSR